MKQMMMSAAGNEIRLAIWEQRRLTEYHTQRKGISAEVAGNIYRARVTNVIPNMQAAFVDIGLDKHAFLYIDDCLPASWKKAERGTPKPNIRQLVQIGEEVLVQVTKEAQGSKASSVSKEISFPGRMLVYLPSTSGISLSRKIQQEQERERLRNVLEPLLADGEGVIVRTQAVGVPLAELERELAFLRKSWQDALKAGKEQKIPALLYQESDLVMRTAREFLTDDVDELLIESFSLFEKVKETVKTFHPRLVERLKLYQGKEPLFSAFGVDEEVNKALARHVHMNNGGVLVIDHTEAMTVIDVNTGKFTGRSAQNLEETVTQMNLEAVPEIARQLRLRDIGGIIVIDFINMRSSRSRDRLVSELRKELAKDRTTTTVLGITQLGLVEMTRKKVRNTLTVQVQMPCPVCSGTGRVLSVDESLCRLVREVEALARVSEGEAVFVELHPVLADVLGEDEVQQFETSTGVNLYHVANAELPFAGFRVLYVGADAVARERMEKR